MGITIIILAMIWVLVHLGLLIKLGFWGQYLGGQTWLYDFDSYYRLAGDVLREINPYSVSYMQTPGPLLVILPFLPFTWLDLGGARTFFTLINIIAGYAACGILAVRYWPKTKISAFWILATILFSAFTTRFNFITGQSGLMIMLVLTVALVSKKYKQAGLFLAFAVILKTYLIFGILGIVRKSWKTAMVAGAVVVGIAVVSLGVFKPEWWVSYAGKQLGQIVTSSGGSADLDYYSQTMRATFHRMRWDGVYPVVYGASLVLGAVWLSVSGSLETGIVISLLLSPVVWQHYYVILFPVLVKLWAIYPKKRLLISALSVWLWAELKFVHGKPVIFPWSILASQYFLGGVLVLILLLIYADSILLQRKT